MLGSTLGLVAALTLFAPAAWLGAALTRLSQGRLLLQDARGTVWTGSSRLLLTGGSGSRDLSALPGRIDWRLRPTWAGLTLALNAPCCTSAPVLGTFHLGWQTQDLYIDNAILQWPAALLMGLGTPFNTIQAEGSLRLSTQQLVLQRFEGRVAFAGAVQLQATDISSRLSTVAPMGSYQLVLPAADDIEQIGKRAQQLRLDPSHAVKT